jgi:hypothetical protein
VFVTAQVVVQADLVPILPGSEFPNIDDDLLTGLILVHRAPTTADPLWKEDGGLRAMLCSDRSPRRCR